MLPGGIPPNSTPGSQVPLTQEWFNAQKKLLKQGELSDDIETRSDSYIPSDQAKGLVKTKEQAFLQEMADNIDDLDPDSENFFPEATDRMIDSVIEKEFGGELKKNPEYIVMKDKISQTIMDNPSYRDSVVDFLELLLLKNQLNEESGQ